MNSAELTHWQTHLETCSECAAELQVWAALVEKVTRAHLVSAPEELVSSAKAIFRANVNPDTRPSLRQIIATVIFDSFNPPAALAFRAETAAAMAEDFVSRQVVFQAEEYDIYMRLSQFEDHRDLLGQILPRDSGAFISDANLYLRHEDERIASAAVNELGEFYFSDIPEGMLSLQIDLPNMTIISALHVSV